MTIQAEDNLAKTRSILDLYDDTKRRATELTRSPYAIRVLDWIFGRPIFRKADLASAAGISASAARRLLDAFCEDGILRTINPAGGRRAAILVFPQLLSIVEGVDSHF